jgi:hypothetical protein
MSIHASKDADTMRDVDVATNTQAVASGMEWDNEERKQASAAAAAAAAGQDGWTHEARRLVQSWL